MQTAYTEKDELVSVWHRFGNSTHDAVVDPLHVNNRDLFLACLSNFARQGVLSFSYNNMSHTLRHSRCNLCAGLDCSVFRILRDAVTAKYQDASF